MASPFPHDPRDDPLVQPPEPNVVELVVRPIEVRLARRPLQLQPPEQPGAEPEVPLHLPVAHAQVVHDEQDDRGGPPGQPRTPPHLPLPHVGPSKKHYM